MEILAIQTSMFNDLGSFTPTNERLDALMKILPGFLPNVFSITKIDGNTGNSEKIDRIELRNEKEKKYVRIMLDRLDVNYIPEKEMTKDNVEAEIKKCASLMSKILKSDIFSMYGLFNRMAQNIQFVTEKSKHKLSPSKYIKIEDNFNGEVAEWSFSVNYRNTFNIGGTEEKINTVIGHSLGKSNKAADEYAILNLIDVNTSQENGKKRFSLEEFERFSDNSFRIIEKELAQL